MVLFEKQDVVVPVFCEYLAERANVDMGLVDLGTPFEDAGGFGVLLVLLMVCVLEILGTVVACGLGALGA